MKIEEARKKIAEIITKKETATVSEISYAVKGAIPPIQIYTVLAAMVKSGALELTETDGNKTYTLIDESKLIPVSSEKQDVSIDDNIETKAKKGQAKQTPEDDEEEDEKPTKDKIVSSGRDLTKYKFNGQEYNKGRLAHAVIAQYAKDKKPTYKAALEIFPHDMVPPYGMIKPIKEAKQISKERQRFFIKPEEEIKFKDEVVAVSNQWTKERVEKLIKIAKKQLGYTIR